MTPFPGRSATAVPLLRPRDAGLAQARALIDAAFEERQAGLACRAGCCFCCHHSVICNKAEAKQIAKRIEDDSVIVARVRRAAEVRSGLDAKRILALQQPCPLLDPQSGMCGVYDIRPLACRGCASRSRNACKRALRGFRAAVPMDVTLFRKASQLRSRLAGNADNPQGELAVMVNRELGS